MPASLRFVIADVFTDRPFGGNQLAVFPDADGLDERLMQSLAREINFSETTFVQTPTRPGHTHRVRIFTPAAEIPFAGHPTVGTAAVLAAAGGKDLVFEEGVGPLPVEVDLGRDAPFARFTLARAAEIRPAEIDGAVLAAMLSLPASALGATAPWAATLGGAFYCIVPLADPEAVAAARLDTGRWAAALPPDSLAREIYAVAGDFTPGGTIKVRMWAPSHGIAEDPATGSAAAALVASLAQALPQPSGRFAWTILQGAEIGRPSRIEAEAEKRDGTVIAVRIGGSSVIVGEGVIRVSDSLLAAS